MCAWFFRKAIPEKFWMRSISYRNNPYNFNTNEKNKRLPDLHSRCFVFITA